MNRKEYSKDYRHNYGEKMKEQIRKWFQEHAEYRKSKCKEWKMNNLSRYNKYLRNYMRKYRQKKKLNISPKNKHKP